MNGKWTFNEQDDGCWNHDDYATKEEAINAAREYLCDDQPVMYVGQCKTVPLPSLGFRVRVGQPLSFLRREMQNEKHRRDKTG